MNTKERSRLRSIAQTIEPIGQIGKGGVSENMLKGLSDALDARELIKLTVLKNSDDEAFSRGRYRCRIKCGSRLHDRA